jgi:raffinose/stachyose/melibiose transport system substrate-binding protein
MRKGLALVLIVVVVVLVGATTAGSSRQAAPSGTLHLIWLTELEPGMQVMVKNFQNVYPNITVQVQYVPSATYTQTLLTQFQAGNAPDLLYTIPGASLPYGIWALGPNGSDKLADLSGSPWVQRILPSVRPYMSAKRRIYAAPLGLNPAGIFYNVEVFNSLGLKPPKTFSDLTALCQKLSAAGKVPIAYQGPISSALLFNVLASSRFVYTSDPKWTVERLQHKVSFTSSAGWRRALLAWTQLRDAKCFSPGAVGTLAVAALRQIAVGDAAMTLGSSALYGAMLSFNPNLNVKFIDFPGDNSSQSGTQLNLSLNLAISKDSRNIAAAKTFLNFLERPKQDALFNKVLGGVGLSDFVKHVFPPQMSALAADKTATVTANYGWPAGSFAIVAGQQYVGLLTGQTASVDDALKNMEAAWGH